MGKPEDSKDDKQDGESDDKNKKDNDAGGWGVGRWQSRQSAAGWREGGDLFRLGDKKDDKGDSNSNNDDNAD